MQFNVNRLLGSGSGHGDAAGGICEQLPSTAWTGLEGMDGAKPFLEATGDMRGCSPRSPSTGTGWTRGNTSSPRDHHLQSCTQPAFWSITHKKNKPLTILEACNTPLSLPSGSRHPPPWNPTGCVGGRKEPHHQQELQQWLGPPPALSCHPKMAFLGVSPIAGPLLTQGFLKVLNDTGFWSTMYLTFFSALRHMLLCLFTHLFWSFFLVKGTFSHISKSASTPTRQGLHDHPLNDAFS